MKFTNPISVKTLAAQIGAEIIGDDSLLATGINEIHKVEAGDITFSDVEKYFEKALQSKATIILLPNASVCPPGKAILVCNEPFEVYNNLIKENRPFEPNIGNRKNQIIHPTAIIEDGVVLSNNIKIGANSYIQANTFIGEYTEIGDNVVIQSGAIIGTDAFYFKKKPDGFHPWRSGGRVIIEDNVQIGAGCTINKGVSGDTIIGYGTKMDCQVHIGHGVVIGKHCLITAQVGIGGKTIVGNNVVIYGQVGVAQNVMIGDNVVILAKSGVSKNLEKDKTYFGIPAEEIKEKYRELAALRQLPDLLKRK